MPMMWCWCSSTRTTRGGCSGCWRSGWRNTAFGCTRRRRGWWTFVARGRSPRGGSQRERSFVMLGFTHYWGRSRTGRWGVKRKTAKDRFSRALKAIGQWCRNHRHWKLRDQQAALSRKLRGHYAYYGITGNFQALNRFRFEVERLWRKWLGRRSWRGRMTWVRFGRLRNNYPLPPARVVHSVYR